MPISTFAALTVVLAAVSAGPRDTAVGDRMLDAYFAEQVQSLRGAGLTEVTSSEAWENRREGNRERLRYMLGLERLPERTPLEATVTGKIQGDGFSVERLYFQSSPGLYVTCNLYLPSNSAAKAPTILYLCGHSRQFDGGISLGNKTGYQHYGPWFARHGYVCLMVDTLQLGEVQGVHDGAHRKGRFWWYSRGYTPAGVEVWNAMRGLDYLESRPEVDGTRIGVTGRSGGGGYSWYLTALDDRVKASVPIAGMTDLAGQFADGTIGRHCDCMFQINTYQWDFPTVAAMTAPRPLMLGATDRDASYPLDGVTRLFFDVRRIYDLYGKRENLSLAVGPGIHEDTQESQLACLRWFETHLKGNADAAINSHAEKLLESRALKVLADLPTNAVNATLDERFVAEAETPSVPSGQQEWLKQREAWREKLLEATFRGWPQKADDLNIRPGANRDGDGLRHRVLSFVSQGPFRLSLEHIEPSNQPPSEIMLVVLDDQEWQELQQCLANAAARQQMSQSLAARGLAVCYFAPRGIGPTLWRQDPPQHDTQIRRRFMLLGQTLDGMRVWDVRRALAALRETYAVPNIPVSLQGNGSSAVLALYASLFEPRIRELRLQALSASHRDAPALLNVARHLTMPQVLAMAADQSVVSLADGKPEDWQYALATAQQLAWLKGRITFDSEHYLPLPKLEERGR